MINGEIKLEDKQVKGTRILCGDLAATRRKLINTWADIALARGYQEITLPSIEKEEIYTDKVGEELVERQMYRFEDKKGRKICLRPEGTATCQLIAQKYKYDKDIKLFYETRCWRYEQPQSGRYREFSQFGVEVLNPRGNCIDELIDMATEMLTAFVPMDILVVNKSAQRGLSYYVGDGFEIEIPDMGAQRQVVGGGTYAEGVGFAIGLDRFLARLEKINEKS
jgi:histidyl-tRNA synthetase